MSKKKKGSFKNSFLEGVEVIYPLLLTIFIVISDFVECISNFYHALRGLPNPKTGHPCAFLDFKPDIFTICVIASLVPWYFLHRRNQNVAKDEAREDMRNNLSGIRHERSFQYARAFINECHEKLVELNNAPSAGTDRVTQIANVLLTINICIQSFTRDFLQLDDQHIGVNYMLYFDTTDLSPDILNELLGEESLCVVQSEQPEAVLSLIPQLNLPIDQTKVLSRMCLPMYPANRHVYNKPHNLTDITLPGAPLAYIDGAAVIENTRDIEAYPDAIKDEIKDKLINYFASNASSTNGLFSFAVPPHPGQTKSIGVLNIETSKSHDYKSDERIINNFYTILCSILIINDIYLHEFRNNMIALLIAEHANKNP